MLRSNLTAGSNKDEDAGADSAFASRPSVSLPKGGGAIQGMGEKFAANPVTGTAAMSVPIATSPGRAGFEPQLALSYDSGAGNGAFGFGWSLSVPAVTRKTSQGLPRYFDAEESDTFILSGTEDMVPVLAKDAQGEWQPETVAPITVDGIAYSIQRYRPRIEGLFARIERWTHPNDPAQVFWRSVSRDNITAWYGKDQNSRIADPANPARIFSWLLCESYDDKGNVIAYRYKEEDSANVDLSQSHERNRSDESRSANRYLKRVQYGNREPYFPVMAADRPWPTPPEENSWLFELVFDYGEHNEENPQPAAGARQWNRRLDPFSAYRAGFEVRTYRLCQRALMFHHFPDLTSGAKGYEGLVSATEFTYSYEAVPSTAQDPVYSRLLAVTQRGYNKDANGNYSSKVLPPLAFEYSEPRIDDTVREVDSLSLENLPEGLDGDRYQWVDLDGEGLPGILTEQGGGWFYKRNLSPVSTVRDHEGERTVARFSSLEKVGTQPAIALANGAQFLDLAGDGLPDLVSFQENAPGFYERSQTEDWDNFVAFESLPNLDWQNPNLRFIDLDGDGRSDILMTEDDCFFWHLSLMEKGFGSAACVSQPWDEERGPRVVFEEATQSIFLADMTGDGLTDIVRIRNGEISYWPNLGYGRFGAKVTMDSAPWFDRPELFEPRRIALADIDGSGTTDVLYLSQKGVQVYFNQSGNSWSVQRLLSSFPAVDNMTSFAALDLLGSGTACLVWSSPLPVDGRRVMRYIDLMGGQKPHLLIKTINNLGAETRVTYAPSTKFYLQDKLAGKPWITKLPFPVHVVEQVEAVDFISRSRFVMRYAYHHGYFDGAEREFRGFGMVEQWDTEAFEDYVVGVRQVEGNQEQAPELYQPPVLTRTWYHTGAFLDKERILHQFRQEYYQQAQHILEPDLPVGLETQEVPECLRSLKGLSLRQEVYSFDGSTQAEHPYTVVENNFEIRLLQPRKEQKYAVFLPIGQESVFINYERNPADPRVSHSLNLEVDQYGNAVKSCSVVYGRKNSDPALPAEVIRDQQQLYISYAETDFTSDIDRLGSTPAYRLRVPYESRSYEITGISPSAPLFQLDELRSQIASAAEIAYDVVADGSAPQKRLLAQERVLFLDNALSPLPLGQWDSLALGHQGYQLVFTPEVVTTHYAGNVTEAELIAAGYLHFDGDANWWMPSGTAIYPNDPASHFYIPTGAREALGLETIGTLDEYDLLVERIRVVQAPWSETVAVNDYRVLGPTETIDPNQNRAAVEIDELGLVVKSAVMGKAGAGEGDTLENPTTRMEYELFNWMDRHQPNFVHTFAREQHGEPTPRWQESYTYANGSGGVALVKAQAHSGTARQVSPDGTVSEVSANPRWIGNGRTILNNKGNPVKQYEPYFSTTHEYEEERVLREIGVTPVLYYDAVGRNIRTLFPNKTFSRVEFDPWMQRVFDANDTVRESEWYTNRGSPDPTAEPEPVNNPERRAAWLAAKHADTPGMTYFDSLGRSVYAVSDYGGGKTAAVYSESDLTGRYAKLFDQAQREVASGFVGMSGVAIWGESAEKGRRWTFVNVLGNLVKSWDEHGRAFRVAYDELHRPVGTYVKELDAAEILFSYVVYGDRAPNAQQRNLLGIAHQIFDQAGMVRVPEVDFKGNPKRIERVLAEDYKNNLNWQVLAEQPDYASVQTAASSALENEVFTASSTYDALNRPTRALLPDGTVILPTYNEANFLSSLQAQIRGQGDFIEFLKDQDYDAKGQRQFAHYGNEVLTRYFYDSETFRLNNLLTYRVGEDPETQGLQNLHYTYDPIGNITQSRDDAQQTHYFNNAVVRPENLYEYDAIYQLVRATGREHASLGNNAIRSHSDLDFVPQLPHANDAGAVRTYTEEYKYDLLGNIQVLRHRYQAQAGAGSGWTRHYQYAYEMDGGDRTNRLSATSAPGDLDDGPYSATYRYDAYGNMTQMPHLTEMTWNFMDQLRRVDLGGGGTAYYVYGISGQRIRKVIEQNANARTERIYLGGVEIYREWANNIVRFERRTVHISDNAGRIAQVDIKTQDDNNSDPANPLNTSLIRYQYGDRLGSAVVETNENGEVISREEYHPYGTTAYRSTRGSADISLKRYRFSGKERDDETGLYYFGARYYVAWLGRWSSSDPAGFVDGINLFRYCSNNPIMLHDRNGTDGERHEYSLADLGLTGEEDAATVSRVLREHGLDFTGFDAAGNELEPDASGRGVGLAKRVGGVWEVGTWLQPPGDGDGEGASGAVDSGTDSDTDDEGDSPPADTESESSESDSGGGLPPVPPRPALTPTAPSSPTPTNPVPKLDITPAPDGTDFSRLERAARAAYRQRHGITGRQTAVQHPQKWRDGARTGTHPRITNHPDFLHPIDNRRGTGGTGDNGRPYATQHTLADRGRYPSEAARTRSRYGSWATERVTTLWAGQRVRRRTIGSRGPWFLREYIVAPMIRGVMGHAALAATRTFVPGIIEAELGLMGGGMLLYQAGYQSAGVAVFGAASYVPVVGGGLVAGAVVGNAAESIATEFGASRSTAQGVGFLAAAGGGAGVGALIGSVIPGVGTAVGAGVGAVAGVIGYGLSKLF